MRTALASTKITPLDPNSERGRETAERLSQVLAEIFIELDTAKAVEAARLREQDPS